MNKIHAVQAAALRVTSEQVDSKIVKVEYHSFPDSQLTICAMTLQNGEVVTGESIAPVGEEFIQAKGEAKAREKARGKIWALERYLLREQAYQIQQQNELHGLMSGMLGAADLEAVDSTPGPWGEGDLGDFVIVTTRLGDKFYLHHVDIIGGDGKPQGGYTWVGRLSAALKFANRREARFFIQNNLAQAERMQAVVSRVPWEQEEDLPSTVPESPKPFEVRPPLPPIGQPYDDLARDFSQATYAPAMPLQPPQPPQPPQPEPTVDLEPINSMRPEGNVLGNWWIIRLSNQDGSTMKFYCGLPKIEAPDEGLACYLSRSLTDAQGEASTFISLQEARECADLIRGAIRPETKVTIIERECSTAPRPLYALPPEPLFLIEKSGLGSAEPMYLARSHKGKPARKRWTLFQSAALAFTEQQAKIEIELLPQETGTEYRLVELKNPQDPVYPQVLNPTTTPEGNAP